MNTDDVNLDDILLDDERMHGMTHLELRCAELGLRYQLAQHVEQLKVLQGQHRTVENMLANWTREKHSTSDSTAESPY